MNRLEAGVINRLPGLRQAAALCASLALFASGEAEAYHEVKTLETLPGYGLTVDPAHRQLLADSTVKLINRTPPEAVKGGLDMPNCTGVKLRISNNTFISSAAHCFSEATDENLGLLEPEKFPATDAADFIQRSPFIHLIEDGQEYVQRRQPLGQAYGLSISTRNQDVALLKIAPEIHQSDKLGAPKRSYRQLGSLILRNKPVRPLPGQEVALFSLPESNLDKPVKDTGRYLGSVVMYSHDDSVLPSVGAVRRRRLDVVGINPEVPYEDACDFGGSGSSYVASTGKPASAYISGPLSLRLNSTYDPYRNYGGSYGSNAKDSLKRAIEFQKSQRAYIKYKLGFSTTRFSTLCLFQTVARPTYNSLVKNFGNFAPIPEIGDAPMIFETPK
jgi:hypothetical protein